MTLLSRHDFDSPTGQEKIIKTIHTLDHKVRELQQVVHELARKEHDLEKDLQDYDPH